MANNHWSVLTIQLARFQLVHLGWMDFVSKLGTSMRYCKYILFIEKIGINERFIEGATGMDIAQNLMTVNGS